MRPPEVLDHQGALIDYLDSRYFHGYLQGFMADMVKKGTITGVPDGKGLAEMIRNSLRVAQAFHVQKDMMPLIRAAATDLEDTDYLTHERLPAEHGFLMFDDPWLTQDVWGDRVVVAAFNWRHGVAHTTAGTAVPGIWLTWFTDIYDERDDATARLKETSSMDSLLRIGRYHVSHIWFVPYGQRLGPAVQMTDAEYQRYSLYGQTLAEKTPNDARMVVALFRLLNQVIVQMVEAPVDRTTRRRADKAGIPARVQTIRLRRKEYVGGERSQEFQGALSHRFVVRGHWAWRKCGAEHPLAEEYDKGWHARVYIAPFWKGPEDGPIQITEKVWSLAQ